MRNSRRCWRWSLVCCKAFSALAAVAAAGCLLLAGCARGPAPSVVRWAVLPAENLTGNPAYDWVGPALAAVVAEEFTGSPEVDPRAVASLPEATAFRASGIIYSYFTERDGRLRLRVALEETATNQIVRYFHLEGRAGALLPLAEAVARRLGTPARRFGTRNEAALRAYGEALATADEGKRAAALRRALAADPHFPRALLAVAQTLVARGYRERARRLIQAAAERPDAYDEVSLARFDVFLASLEQDPAAMARALERMAAAVPADSGLAERAAQAELGLHHYQAAAAWFQRAARIEPSRGELWNSRAYALAYAGDLEGANRSLERYRQAEPDSPNVLDSFGEVNFRFRRYADAARYFLQTYDKAPDFQGSVALVKAARARLMLGDLAGADNLFHQYAELRRQAGDPWIDYRAIQWQFTTGRRRRAIEEAEKLAQGDRDARVAASLHAQLSVWALLAGDREGARRHASTAARNTAAGGPSRPLALLCEFLAGPPAGAAEWRRRARRAFPEPAMAPLRTQALTYAYLFSRNFAEAANLLRDVYRQAPPFVRDQTQVLWGWALLESGHLAEAGRLLSVDPIVQPGTESVFYCLVFPRIFYLRAQLAEKSGNRAEAARNYRLFLRYSGDLPTIFGEQAKARQALQSPGASHSSAQPGAGE